MTVPREGARSRRARVDVLAVGLVSGLVAAYLVVSWAHGALGAGRNDDWTYYRSAWQFAADGYFNPDPYTMAMIVGQTLGAQPLVALAGADLVAYQVSVAALGGVGLYASYAVIRSFLPRGWALLAVGSLALGPIFGSISVTFMSDVPAFAFQALSLWAGVASFRAAGASRAGWLATSLAIGLLAFTVREYGIVAPVAVLALHAWNARSRPRTLAAVVGLGVVVVTLAAAVFVWRAGLGAEGSRSLGFRGLATLGNGVRSAFTLALLVLPAVAVAAVRLPRTLSRRPVGATAAMAVVGALGVVVWKRAGQVLLPNYLTPWGSYPETLHGPGVEVVPTWLWPSLNLLSLVSAAVVVGLLIGSVPLPRRGTVGPPTPSDGFLLSAVFSLLAVAAVIGAHALAGAPLFDRYLLPAVPFAAGVVIAVARGAGGGRRLVAPAAAASVVWAVLGFHYVDAAATFDGLKWRAGQSLEELGYDPETIEAGLEWFGLHQEQEVRPRQAHPGQLVFWWGLFDEPRVCVLVSTATAGTGLEPAATPSVLDLSARSALGVEYRVSAYPVADWCGEVE